MRHWTDRLSEYVDGDLSPREMREAERHLADCTRCAEAAADLREVVRRARALGDRPPERDLWPGIRSGIRDRRPGIVELSSPGEAHDALGGRWIRMSLSQAVAAALALVLLTGAASWSFGGGFQRLDPDRGGAFTSRSVPMTRGGDGGGTDDYAGEIRRLQRLLESHRDRLTPATVRVLERNLAVIDRAIEESRDALEAEPESEYLADHLRGTLRRKVEFLREAAATLSSAT